MIPFMFFLSLVLWIFSFSYLLTGEWGLISDATSYYDHIKFFIDNILRGVYPMWDPAWGVGVPNEFFLRRIGVFNPFFSLILVLRTIGMTHRFAYLIYLVVYYFVGGIGFYLVAKRIFRDTKTAFTAYLLLLFSSLGTRLFDSYLMLIFVPMVWFFYFLTAFTQEPKKHLFLGMVFTLMVILTTYIPFYFVTVFISFVICFALIYVRNLKSIFLRYFQFFKGNKIFGYLCAVALMVSILPGLMLYRTTGKGELVFPHRHYDYDHTKALTKNELEVDIYNITKWGGLEDIVYSATFTDLRKFKFAVLYIPIFAYVLFFLGIFTGLNKRLFVFALWAFVLFLIAAPFDPFYQFLYDHIFFFKYFRNLHFFIWVALLPVFILFVVEQMRMFLNYHPVTKRRGIAVLAFLGVVHVGLAVFLYAQGNAIPSSYGVLGLSFLFFILHFIGKLRRRNVLFLFLLFILVVAQPLEVFQYLRKNLDINKFPRTFYYEQPYLDFSFTRGEEKEVQPEGVIQKDPGRLTRKYIGTYWYNFLYESLHEDVLKKYVRHRFIVYDRVEGIDQKEMDMERIGRAFLKNQNTAFVAVGRPEYKGPEGTAQHPVPPTAQLITGNSEQFQVLKYDSNSIKVMTNFDSRKFLVYNDSFHSGWQAFINGKEVELFRANVAFKGLWIPAGENIVYLRYGAAWCYFIELLLMGIFTIVFVCLIWWSCKDHLRFGVPIKDIAGNESA